MAEKIIMPQGGQDLKFGTVVRWFKKEGEPVKKDELVCEVETEKAVFEVNAMRDGILLKIVKQDGEEAEVLSAIGYIGDAGEEVPVEKEKSAQNIFTKDASNRTSITHKSDPKNVKISPKARKLARDHGLDISALRSTRPDGKISSEDIERAIAAQDTATEKLDISGGHIVPLKKIQSVSAKRLARSWNQAPHFFVTVSVDMTDAITARKIFNDKAQDAKISINDMVIKATSIALKKIPAINATYQDENSIILWDEINIVIATASEDGLLVPVLEQADQMSIQEISQQVKVITNAAREGKQISGSSSHFTISNLGMYHIDRFSAIINPPESAILAVASVQKKAIVNENEDIVVRDMMEMTLSLDHRIGDGVLAAEFINLIKSMLESPENLF